MGSNSSNVLEQVGISFKNKYCYCGKKALIRISESEKNPNKLFYKCDSCKFFSWWEDESKVNCETASSREWMNSNRSSGHDHDDDDYERIKHRLAKLEANQNGVYVILFFLIIVFFCLLLKL